MKNYYTARIEFRSKSGYIPEVPKGLIKVLEGYNISLSDIRSSHIHGKRYALYSVRLHVSEEEWDKFKKKCERLKKVQIKGKQYKLSLIERVLRFLTK